MTTFLKRHRPRPGESLRGLLVVLSDRNRYGTPYASRNIWLRQLNEAGIDDNVLLPRKARSYEVLARLTRLSASRLFGMTAHRFAAVLNEPGSRAEEIIFPEEGAGYSLLVGSDRRLSFHLGSDSSTLYCPDCLDEEAYHRLGWEVTAAAVCLKHSCVLADRCPHCGKKTGVVSVVRNRCRYCGSRLSCRKTRQVGETAFEMAVQRVIQGWFGLCGLEVEPMNLPQKTPAVLYRVLLGLRSCLGSDTQALGRAPLFWPDGLFPGRVKRGDLNPDSCSLLLTAAFKGLQNWPDGFFMILDMARTREDGRFEGNLRRFGNFYVRYLLDYWQGDAFEFVREAFNRYLFRSTSVFTDFPKSGWAARNPEVLEQWPYVSVLEAARLLGITAKSVEKLVENGRLIAANQSEQPLQRVMLRRQDVIELWNWWDDTVSLSEAGRCLGVWHETVLALVKAGFLKAEWGFNRDGSGGWRIRRLEVEKLLEQLAAQTRFVQAVNDLVRLRSAVQALEKVGINLVAFVQQVYNGYLKGWAQVDEEFRLCSLYFDVDDLVELVKRERGERGWLTCKDVARRMGVKDTVVAKWVGAGLLRPVVRLGNQHYFNVERVHEFVSNHVFSDEAAQILGIGRLAVQRWARIGRLKPVAGTGDDSCHRYLFRRADVERLRAGNRLTAAELARELGISRSGLAEWLQQGKVKAVSGPGIDGAGQYLFLRSDSL